MSEEERDRVKNPSINFPQSHNEARRALISQMQRALLGSTGPLRIDRTNDAGLGHIRTQAQTDRLNEAALELREEFQVWLTQALGYTEVMLYGEPQRGETRLVTDLPEGTVVTESLTEIQQRLLDEALASPP